MMANIDRELSAQLGTTPVIEPLCRAARQSMLGNKLSLVGNGGKQAQAQAQTVPAKCTTGLGEGTSEETTIVDMRANGMAAISCFRERNERLALCYDSSRQAPLSRSWMVSHRFVPICLFLCVASVDFGQYGFTF